MSIGTLTPAPRKEGYFHHFWPISALSGLDDHFQKKWKSLGPSWTRAKLRRRGIPVMKLIRYADDFIILVHGSVEHVEALWHEVAEVSQPMGFAYR